ncbi:M48 family metallopeptidase [Sphaerisporangium rhizosphaerae]|uniref:M48 family metallopeptidase n=1 Tax=Sphaerisporangium rhizosphaerae TaxID=2269375 RepID=A0ABW2PB69_9ACTN
MILLVVAAAGALFLDYVFLSDIQASTPGNPLVDRSHCAKTLGTDFQAARTGLGLAYYQCERLASMRFATIALVSVPALAMVTFLIYRLYPLLIGRRLRTVPLSSRAADLPEHVVAIIDGMVARAGRPVDIRIALNRPTTGGRAFGHYPRYRVVLDLGLLAQAADDSGPLRAVLAHELMHVRNRDIDLTYLAMSVWWAFLLVVVAPFLAAGLWYPASVAAMSWRVALLVALLWFARAAVLRSREFYADLRAAEAGAGAPLREILRGRAAMERDSRPARMLRAFSYHPAARARLAVLDDAAPLFRLYPSDGFVVGAFVGLAFTPLLMIARMFWTSVMWTGVAVGLIFSALLAGSLGGAIWRQTHHRLAAGRPPGGIAAGAAALAAGILAGQLVTPPLFPINGLTYLVTGAPVAAVGLVAVLFALSYLMLRWVAVCAGGWLPVVRRPRRAYVAGVVVAAVVLGGWLAIWFQMQALMMETRAPADMISLTVFSIALNQPMLVAVAVALLYPALAWTYTRLRRRPDGVPLAASLVPVPVALATVLAVAVASTVVPLAFLEQVRLADRAAAGAQGVNFGGFLPPLVIGAMMSTLVGLVVGLTVGGRRRTSPVVMSTGLASLITGPYVLLMSFAAVWLAECGGWPGALVCLQKMPASTISASGALVGMWFSAVCVAGVAAAAAGSGIRAAVEAARRRPLRTPSPPPRARPVRGVAAMLPFAAVFALFVYVIAHPVFVPYTALGPANAEAIRRQPMPAPNSWTGAVACTTIQRLFNDYTLGDVTQAGGIRSAQAVAAAVGSDNGPLAALGRELAAHMRAAEEREVNDMNQAVSWYCDLTIGSRRPTGAA